jgi:hypothetical protein
MSRDDEVIEPSVPLSIYVIVISLSEPVLRFLNKARVLPSII